MFEDIVNIVSSTNTDTYQKPQEYLEIDSDVRNFILPLLPGRIIQQIICDTTRQSEMKTINRSCFNYDKTLKSFVQQDGEFLSDDNMSPFIVEYYDEMVFLEMININDLADYLSINSHCEFIALPVLHGFHDSLHTSKHMSAHITTIIFDNINKLVYHIDSNGWGNTENFLRIENFIEQNMNMLADLDVCYNYVRCEFWNTEQIYLNIDYHHNELNSRGNCMTWTILIIKLLQETKLFPSELFDKLEKLEYEEKIFIMKTYGTYLLNTYARVIVEKIQQCKISDGPNIFNMI